MLFVVFLPTILYMFFGRTNLFSSIPLTGASDLHISLTLLIKAWKKIIYFPKMKPFQALQIVHYMAIIQAVNFFGNLVNGFDGDIIFLYCSTRPLSGTPWE